MNQKLQSLALQLAKDLRDVEASVEYAVMSTSKVITSMYDIKTAASLTVFHAQDPLDCSSELLSLLSKTRIATAKLHQALDTAQADILSRPISFGPVGKPSSSSLVLREAS